MVRLFESGDDAAVAVLTTALYQAQPPAANDALADQPGEGRKLLTFSDSRQAAAFLAPTWRRATPASSTAGSSLRGEGAPVPVNYSSIDDLTFHVAKGADRAHVFTRKATRQERERHTALWIMQELIALDERQSLESWAVPGPTPPVSPMAHPIDLQRPRLQRRGVMVAAIGTPAQPAPPRRARYARGSRSSRRSVQSAAWTHLCPRGRIGNGPKVLSWLPTRGVNRRLDYVRRVLQALGSDTDPEKMLRGCWRAIVNWPDHGRRLTPFASLGTVREFEHTWPRLAPTQRAVYRCSCADESPQSPSATPADLGLPGAWPRSRCRRRSRTRTTIRR